MTEIIKQIKVKEIQKGKEKRNVPKLRFRGFEDEWKENRLGNIGEFKNGVNKSKEDFGFGYPFINLMDVFERNYIEKGDFGLINVNERELIENNLIKGDVLFVRSSVKRQGIGLTVVIKEDLKNTVYSGFLIRFREFKNTIYDDYKKYCFSTDVFRKKLLAKSSTSANTNISQESLKILDIKIPSLQEQKKIANFLSLVDKKIEKQSEKVEALKTYKKGIMQKIFKQEIRFKDENGREYPEWENKMFYECFDNIGGTSLEEFSNTYSKYKFISIGSYSYNGKYIDDSRRIELNDKTKTKLLDKDNLVMVLNDKTSKGIILGSTILIDEDNKYIFNQRSERLICKKNINPKFAWCKINSAEFKKRILSIAQGGTQIYIKFSNVKKIEFNLPCLKEQVKIANFLTTIDKKIEKEEEKLEELKVWKKGLLQKMFV